MICTCVILFILRGLCSIIFSVQVQMLQSFLRPINTFIVVTTGAITTRCITGFIIWKTVEVFRKPASTYRMPYEYMYTFLNIATLGGALYAYNSIK